jgi:calcium-dependent protein kinase
MKDNQISNENFINQKSTVLKNDYRLIKKLGAGAYSEVFLAQHKITNIYRCIKVISRQNFDYSDNEDIMNEINLLRKIDHPNIMRIIEYYMS